MNNKFSQQMYGFYGFFTKYGFIFYNKIKMECIGHSICRYISVERYFKRVMKS